MRERIALAITVLFLALIAGPVLSGWSAPSAFAQEPATYSFTECEEGWTVAQNFTPAVGSPWARSAPGADAGPDSLGSAFRSAPYPWGFNPDDPEDARIYEGTVTSPAHTSTGAEITVTYSFAHDLEACCDFFFLEWSTDGTKWTEGAKFEGLSADYPGFSTGELKIKPDSGALHLRFRHTADQLAGGEEGATGGHVAFDEVSLNLPRPAGTACGEEEPSNTPSQTTTATSTATPTQSPSPTNPPTNPPKRCTERGTRKGERLRGTRQPDRLCAKAGNDKLYGLRANDMLLGGKGRDLLVGGRGRDTCRGGPGKDRFRGCEAKRQ